MTLEVLMLATGLGMSAGGMDTGQIWDRLIYPSQKAVFVNRNKGLGVDWDRGDRIGQGGQVPSPQMAQDDNGFRRRFH